MLEKLNVKNVKKLFVGEVELNTGKFDKLNIGKFEESDFGEVEF